MAGSAKVSINNDEFTDMETNVGTAYELLEDAEEIWGTNFDNLYNNIVTSGYLQSLYDDAISNWHKFKGTVTVVAGIVSAAGVAAKAAAVLIGAVTLGPVGWVALAIAAIGAIALNISGAKTIASEPNWYTTSKEVFENLLENCVYGNDDSYIQMVNTGTKLYNVQIGLEEIRTKINEFQKLYADLKATADKLGVKTSVADDGVTVLSVDTEVTIDGEVRTVSTSEALNAFFTYNETVISAEVEADYLSRTYGIDINYTDIVKNANTFMANTLKSGLYTHEFIEGVLPSYTPDIEAAKKAGADRTKLGLDKINDALSNTNGLLGNSVLAAGLLGIPLLGTLGKDTGATPANPSTGSSTSGNNGTSSNSSSGGTPSSNSNTGTPSSGTSGSNSGNTSGSSPSDSSNNNNNNNNNNNDNDKDKDKDKDKDTPKNSVEIPKLSETELPEEVESVYEVDYDKLAREEFEFGQDFDKIMEDRANLIADVETKYDNGDLDSLKTQLSEFGYTSTEVEAIIASKFLTSKAILEGTQRAELAQRAEALAEAAGVEDFKSKYLEKPSFKELSEEEASEELMLSSGDKKVTDAYDKMKEARDDYTGKVDDANEALIDVNNNKKTIEEIKAKYEKEFGEDTSEWSEDAAKEYKDAIDKYNDSVKVADEKIKEANKAQEAYEKANGDFEKAKEDFYKNGSSSDGNDGSVPELSQGTTGASTSGSDKPTFAEPTEYSTSGVTIDGVLATGTTNGNVNNGASNQDLFVGDNTLNLNAAYVADVEQQILRTLEEKDGDLIQH